MVRQSLSLAPGDGDSPSGVLRISDVRDGLFRSNVAGGCGSTLCAILKAKPALRGVLFDMPHVMEGARKYIAEQGVSQRCSAMGRGFPPVGTQGRGRLLHEAHHPRLGR